MKKLNIIFLILVTSVAYSQIQTNEVISSGQISNSFAFLDASQSNGYDAFNSAGKGIIFPRTDLTLVTVGGLNPNNELYDLEGGGLVGAKTYYDGLVVFNTGTGAIPPTGMGTSEADLVPGFYYYRNTGAAWNTGVWKPIGGPLAAVKSKTVPVTVAANPTSTTLNLGTGVIAANEVTQYYGAKVYDSAGNLVLTAQSNYDKATNVLVTGAGFINQLLPAGTYNVVVEYK